jgi:hypothetical protein
VTHEVVDVAGDPTALLEHRPLGQLMARSLERGRKLRLSKESTTDQQRERDPQDPDTDGDLAWGFDQAYRHRRCDRQQTKRNGPGERPRPAPHNEREHRNLEQQRLVASGTLDHDDWHDHPERENPQGHAPQVRPHRERRDRDRHQDQIND